MFSSLGAPVIKTRNILLFLQWRTLPLIGSNLRSSVFQLTLAFLILHVYWQISVDEIMVKSHPSLSSDWPTTVPMVIYRILYISLYFWYNFTESATPYSLKRR